jgi:ribulose 1,5-bisphosphate carboxylase large subunit-like protein
METTMNQANDKILRKAIAKIATGKSPDEINIAHVAETAGFARLARLARLFKASRIIEESALKSADMARFLESVFPIKIMDMIETMYLAELFATCCDDMPVASGTIHAALSPICLNTSGHAAFERINAAAGFALGMHGFEPDAALEKLRDEWRAFAAESIDKPNRK